VTVERWWRPTREQIAAARGRHVPDVIAPDLRVLFCGINPGLYSGAVGHHFARPGNRFWKALHGAGFTERVLSPFEERDMLDAGLGITNLVERATASADELAGQELRLGAQRLDRKVRGYRPRFVAFLGLSAYRVAFDRPGSVPGPQPERVGGAGIWLLPNPSGLNAHYQLPDLVAAFEELRTMAERR
jgi:double-stranded uracil-DNA glycosylase